MPANGKLPDHSTEPAGRGTDKIETGQIRPDKNKIALRAPGVGSGSFGKPILVWV